MRECACGLPLEPSAGARHWHPDRDPEPRDVAAVVRYGQPSELRQAVRASADKWIETGALVRFYADRTPPMHWREVGTCWAGTRHPVVETGPASAAPDNTLDDQPPGTR